MNVTMSATPDYTMGFSEEYLEVLKRFTAESHAGHLLPYLRPGLRVLDFGCGPGTISVGLAEAVAPGELHGVDMEESQVRLARSAAKAIGLDNAKFHVGDVTDLPFEEGFFDIAHCHNVLMHVPDTRAVLAEAKRVLKPGGIVSCREVICESSFTYPEFGIIRSGWAMFEDLLAAGRRPSADGQGDERPYRGCRVREHPDDRFFQRVQHTGRGRFHLQPDQRVVLVARNHRSGNKLRSLYRRAMRRHTRGL